MQKTKLFLIIIIIVLIAGNIWLAVLFFLNRAELAQIHKQLIYQQTNEKTLSFGKLFIDKVLLGEGIVLFDDRLKLENGVRDINDKEIFSKWQEFTNSQDNEQSQNAVGDLLKLLFNKIYK